MISEPIKEEVTVIGTVPTPPSSGINISGLSPILAGVAGGLPGLIGGVANTAMQFATNELNYRRQMDMYKENRDYNSPKAQMQRFKEAGLNPNLIYGQSNTSQAMNVGTAVSPQIDLATPFQSALSAYNQQRQNNISSAIDYVKFVSDNMNLEWLSTEKKQLWRQLEVIISNLNLDKDVKVSVKNLNNTLEKLRDLEFRFSQDLYDKGYDPDISSKERAIVGMIGQLFEYVGIMSAEDFVRFVWNN